MIQKAESIDIAAIATSYLELFAYEAGHKSNTNWLPGLYPSQSIAQAAFNEKTLYVLKENGIFCGSMILNHNQPSEYQAINWHFTAEAEKILVLHTLCIPPSQKGKGYAKQLIAFALQLAAQAGCRGLRLDTWEENLPAAALYRKLGFRLAGTAPILLQGVIPEQQIFFEKEINSVC